MRRFGTVVRGIRMPVIRQGDDLAKIVVDTLIADFEAEHVTVHDRDVIGLTESIVARAEGNYATSQAITEDVRAKVGKGKVGLLFPILSRNRFLGVLKAIAAGVDELVIQLSYPDDEVGNPLININQIDEKGVDPHTDVFEEAEFRNLFGQQLLHPFTNLDYVQLYREAAPNISIIFANSPTALLAYTDKVITADIHTRERSKRLLKAKGAKVVIGLQDLLTKPIDDNGYNPEYGLLGSNFARDGVLKLFPRGGQTLVEAIQKRMLEHYGKLVEVLVYGDGAFKDPVGHIWELADPVVSPAYTSGLVGVPHEDKFKMLADTDFKDLSGEELDKAMRNYLINKQKVKQNTSALGTTPRRLTDLIGSLCDLTSGSGDKGTPVIYIQGYFDKWSDEN